jgi:hypothetical protein
MPRFFAVLLALACSACSHSPEPRTKPLPAEALLPYQGCTDSSECIRVDNGCCDCANGGATVAIHRKFEKELRDRFQCEDVMCTQRAGDCKFREPVCRNGRCELGARPKLFPKK